MKTTSLHFLQPPLIMKNLSVTYNVIFVTGHQNVKLVSIYKQWFSLSVRNYLSDYKSCDLD